MFEQNPDLIQRRIDDRQEIVREDVARLRSRDRHSLRISLGLAIIRAGERIRGEIADRPREPRTAVPRARYAR
jgi:hypothetical protein